MGLFSRSKDNSANSSSTSLDKSKPPPTTNTYTVPPPGVKPTKKWNYDENQLAQIKELQEYTKTLLLPETDEYYPWEKRFLDDIGTHARYMRASKWKIDNAKQRIKGTIEWRREYKPDLITPDDVSVEAETGKIILSGFDKDARPIIYMRPGRENTETSPRQIRHLIYNLERAIDMMPEGQEQVAIIVDYKSATSSSNPSISTGLKVLHILQNHYVERLGRGLVVNMPWWINAFFSGIGPFMDPITRDKIRFNPKLTELITPDQLDVEYGGSYNYEFKHDLYWPTLTDFCCIVPATGTRVDKAGNPWIPPSGNGIVWALKQHGEQPTSALSSAGPYKDTDDTATIAADLEKTTLNDQVPPPQAAPVAVQPGAAAPMPAQAPVAPAQNLQA